MLSAAPLIFTRLALCLGTLINNLMVSTLGIHVLAASVIVTSIYMGIFIFALGNLQGISTLVSVRHAQKDYAGIIRVLIQGLYYATLIGLVVMVIFYNISLLLRIFHEPESLIGLIKKYYLYFAPSVLPMLWTTVLIEVIIGCSHQKIIYYYGIFRMLLGVFLAYALVMGKFSFPQMGFAGLGFSTTIASILSCLSLGIYLYWRTKNFIGAYINLVSFTNLIQLPKIIRLGLPIGIQMSGEMLAIMFITLLIGHFGVVALASQQIIGQYLLLFSMVPLGLSQAVAVTISKFIAKNKLDLAWEVAYKSLAIMVIFSTIVGLVYIFLPQYLIHPYIHKYSSFHHVELIRITTKFFYYLAIYQLFDGVRIVVSGVLRVWANPLIAMLVGIGCFGLIAIPLSLILIRYYISLGPIIISLSMTVAVIVATILLVWYFMSTSLAEKNQSLVFSE